MTVKRLKKTNLPEFGKKQIDLESFGWDLKLSKSFIIYLPCASTKPYYLSSTHSYFSTTLQEFIPKNWIDLVQICTISEVLGIVPEDVEPIIFNKKKNNFNNFFYEHYPTSEENDIENTRKWLIDFIDQYKNITHISYLTSNIFREICKKIHSLKLFPQSYKPSSALFEFRKKSNIHELSQFIVDIYTRSLNKRIYKWKKKPNQQYLILKSFWNANSFNFKEIRKKIPSIKNPYSVISSLLKEGGYGKGIVLQRIDRGSYRVMPRLRNMRIFLDIFGE